jgi:hypothetical protein
MDAYEKSSLTLTPADLLGITKETALSRLLRFLEKWLDPKTKVVPDLYTLVTEDLGTISIPTSTGNINAIVRRTYYRESKWGDTGKEFYSYSVPTKSSTDILLCTKPEIGNISINFDKALKGHPPTCEGTIPDDLVSSDLYANLNFPKAILCMAVKHYILSGGIKDIYTDLVEIDDPEILEDRDEIFKVLDTYNYEIKI